MTLFIHIPHLPFWIVLALVAVLSILIYVVGFDFNPFKWVISLFKKKATSYPTKYKIF